MKPLRISDEELQRSRNNQEIIDATIQQINKDFESAGFDAPLQTGINFLLVKNKLAEAISYLLNTFHHRFISMLYRIDIPDHVIMYAIDPAQHEPAEIRLADIIIERELLKVLTKRYYKDNL